ncbi:MAG TPA: hypothetical protein VMD98_10530 [Bryocella sp.]|nr:hypothetical protein [Bryocella sp.]
MEIALFGYILYACCVIIWCSSHKAAVEHVAISPGLLRRWSRGCSDLLVFELHPDGEERLQAPRCDKVRAAHDDALPARDDILQATPSSLKTLLQWIPPDSTVVLCNCGLSSRSVQMIEQRLVVHNLSRVYWLE